MPTVPQYNRQPVQQEQFPNVSVPTQAPVEAFGGGNERTRQAGIGAVNEVSDFVVEMKERADQSENLKAKNDFITGLHKLKAGSSDPKDNEPGYMTVKGENSKDVYDVYTKKLKDLYDKAYGQLKNDRQRYLFGTDTVPLRERFDEDLRVHQVTQIEDMEKNRFYSNMDLETNNAAMAAGNTKAVLESIDRKNKEIDRYAKTNGWSEDKIKSFKADEETKANMAVVQKLLATDPAKAKQWYDDSVKRGGINAKGQAKLEGRVDDLNKKWEAKRQSAIIISENPDAADAEKAFAQTRGLKPEIQDEVMFNVINYYRGRKELENTAKTAKFNETVKALTKPSGEIYPDGPFENNLVSLLDPEQQQELKALSEKSISLENKVENPKALYETKLPYNNKPYRGPEKMTDEEKRQMWTSSDPKAKQSVAMLAKFLSKDDFERDSQLYSKSEGEVSAHSSLRSAFVESIIRNVPSLAKSRDAYFISHVKDYLAIRSDSVIAGLKEQNKGKVTTTDIARYVQTELLPSKEFQAEISKEFVKLTPDPKVEKPGKATKLVLSKREVSVKEVDYMDKLNEAGIGADDGERQDIAARISNRVVNIIQNKIRENNGMTPIDQAKELEKLSNSMLYKVRIAKDTYLDRKSIGGRLELMFSGDTKTVLGLVAAKDLNKIYVTMDDIPEVEKQQYLDLIKKQTSGFVGKTDDDKMLKDYEDIIINMHISRLKKVFQ
jgi:hypothetical protein